eukprot:scaffold6404_cov47-Phaeocystis_antarctica.AAC.1
MAARPRGLGRRGSQPRDPPVVHLSPLPRCRRCAVSLRTIIRLLRMWLAPPFAAAPAASVSLRLLPRGLRAGRLDQHSLHSLD